MTHQILKYLWIHSGLRHIRTVCVSAYMRCNFRKLHTIDAIVLVNRMLEVFLPMHCHHRLTVLIKAKEPGITINHRFYPWWSAIFQYTLKAFIYIVLHRNHSCTGIGLCRINIDQRSSLLQLMVNVDGSVLHIQILNRQSCKFRNTHPCLKQNVHTVIILAIVRIIFDEIKESSFLFSCNGLTSDRIIYHHSCQLKFKWILSQYIIIHCHLKCRSNYPSDGMNRRIAFLIHLLQSD